MSKVIQVLMVFHENGELYFCSTEAVAVADPQIWRDRGKTAIVLRQSDAIGSLKELSEYGAYLVEGRIVKGALDKYVSKHPEQRDDE